MYGTLKYLPVKKFLFSFKLKHITRGSNDQPLTTVYGIFPILAPTVESHNSNPAFKKNQPCRHTKNSYFPIISQLNKISNCRNWSNDWCTYYFPLTLTSHQPGLCGTSFTGAAGGGGAEQENTRFFP
jgi:hypothetical protein